MEIVQELRISERCGRGDVQLTYGLEYRKREVSGVMMTDINMQRRGNQQDEAICDILKENSLNEAKITRLWEW